MSRVDVPSIRSVTPPLAEATVYVAGHRGLAGSAVWRALEGCGVARLVGASSGMLDLRNREATMGFVAQERPDVIIITAARVGGILANSTYPADFLSDNLRIQVNLLDAAVACRVPRVLFLGSSCIYPRMAEQPIRESSLLTGPLESTNDAYAIAKISGIIQTQAIRRQHGLPYISAMPTNLYGPGDNFHPTGSHVLPALMRRIHEAKISDAKSITVWGTGSPRREFLHVDDLASALIHLLNYYDSPETVNVGTGTDVTIHELAETIADVVGWQGKILFDTSKPDGTPRKVLDVSRLAALGWQATIDLQSGLRSTYDWFVSNQDNLRS